MKRVLRSIGMVVALILLSVGSPSGQVAQLQADGATFPAFRLPVPANELESAYLGLPRKGDFRLGEIKAEVVLVEILSAYCPHCQRVAPLVDEVYDRIEKDPLLKGKIKIIGIGMSNYAYELDLFREKFKVPFPLFPDMDSKVSGLFKVPGTPTFIGVRVDGKGSEQQIFYKAGPFTDSSRFLAELTQAAGLK